MPRGEESRHGLPLIGILQGDRIWNGSKLQTSWRSIDVTDRSAMHHGTLAVLAYLISAEKADVRVGQNLQIDPTA